MINFLKKRKFYTPSALIAVHAGTYEKDFLIVLEKEEFFVRVCWIIEGNFDEFNIIDIPRKDFDNGIENGILGLAEEQLPKPVFKGILKDIETRKLAINEAKTIDRRNELDAPDVSHLPKQRGRGRKST